MHLILYPELYIKQLLITYSYISGDPSGVICPIGTFRCPEGKCIPTPSVCNYQKDCDKGEDEFQSCRKYINYLNCSLKTGHYIMLTVSNFILNFLEF